MGIDATDRPAGTQKRVGYLRSTARLHRRRRDHRHHPDAAPDPSVTRDTITRCASALYGLAMLALAMSGIVAAACATMLVIDLS